MSSSICFDISDAEQPSEVAYFNKPQAPGRVRPSPTSPGHTRCPRPRGTSSAGSVWFTDANSGFYNVQLTNGVAKLLR